jgi:hypothetical protein
MSRAQFFDYDPADSYEDAEAADLRAEAAAQRRRNAHHFCDVCHGFTGPGSPCAPDEPEEDEDEGQP